MGNFLADMLSLGIEAGIEYNVSMKKAGKAGEILKRLISQEIDVKEFLDMYNTRTHDFSNHQDDIKIMKHHDFEGVFIIHNCTRNIFLVGKAGQVMRKVDRLFRGCENQDVYEDYQDGDTFKVRIIRLEDSEYTNLDKLEQNITGKYGLYQRTKKKKEQKKQGFFKSLFRR